MDRKSSNSVSYISDLLSSNLNIYKTEEKRSNSIRPRVCIFRPRHLVKMIVLAVLCQDNARQLFTMEIPREKAIYILLVLCFKYILLAPISIHSIQLLQSLKYSFLQYIHFVWMNRFMIYDFVLVLRKPTSIKEKVNIKHKKLKQQERNTQYILKTQ